MTEGYIKPDIQVPETATEDPRVGQLLGRRLTAETRPRAVVIGFPSDEGVRRNNGRPGAADGPREIRRWLYRFTPPADCHREFVELLEHVDDLGDLRVSGNVERDQDALAKAVAPYIEEDVFVLVLGGGHETGFGHFLGYVRAGRDVTILNWDSDVDVRVLKEGKAHSGSPFRQALTHESGRCRSYTVAGLLPYSAARAHLEFVRRQGGDYLWTSQLSPDVVSGLYDGLTAPALVTFDLDGVDQAQAPGVSAPAMNGIPVDIWLQAAYTAGRCEAVRSVDVVELNPRHDIDGRTARLAAVTAWQALRGLAEH